MVRGFIFFEFFKKTAAMESHAAVKKLENSVFMKRY